MTSSFAYKKSLHKTFTTCWESLLKSTLSKLLDKMSSRAYFIAIAWHSAVVSTKRKIVVCAWTIWTLTVHFYWCGTYTWKELFKCHIVNFFFSRVRATSSIKNIKIKFHMYMPHQQKCTIKVQIDHWTDEAK
jgi:hypothetical protein